MKISKRDFIRSFGKQKLLQVFAIVGILYLFVFNFLPMFGLLMAFKDYRINMGISGIFTSDWVGLKYFKEFVTDYNFPVLLRNTVVLSLLKIVFSFPMPIVFAIMINELRLPWFKRLAQTVSYLPHFISWIIVAGLINTFFRMENGLVNNWLMTIGFTDHALSFLSSPQYYWWIAVLSDIWKETGWWGIIFLASITSIDQSQYEAATIDGAGRMARIFYITLPGMRSTISVVLIMALGNLFGGGLSGSNFEQAYLLGNAMNAERSNIIQKYIFDVGLSEGRFAYATAVGLIQSIISIILIGLSNFFSKKVTGNGLF